MADPITRYATKTDLKLYALPGATVDAIESDTVNAALEAASREADMYIGTQYTLPLMAVSVDLTKNVAWMAAYTLMSSVGYPPENSQDAEIARRNTSALKYLQEIREGGRPPGLVGSDTANPLTGQAAGARPMGISSSSRGYSSRGERFPRVLFDLQGPRGGFVGD